jgi:hypothetical protein
MSGSVTNPTGSVKGISCTGLVDAYTGNYGGSELTIPPQWQHAVLLSASTGACSREGSGGSYAANEVTVRLTMIGYRNSPTGVLPPVQPPAADLPLTFQGDGTWLATSETYNGSPAGVQRQLKAYFMKAKSNGAAGSDTVATSGTVTFTAMDAAGSGSGGYAGSYDLYFGTDHVTGSFTAPWC